MREILSVPWNGLTTASTFSGCGGSCLGWAMAGFQVVWANEINPPAADSYEANFGRRPDTRDIREVTGAEIRERAGVEIDVLEGSPPCQSFSTAGKREKLWGRQRMYHGRVQRIDDLFFEFVRLVRELQPKVLVAENVSGLVKGVAKGVHGQIVDAFVKEGYRVQARLLDAQWLGVPQQRSRVFYMGVRNDLEINPSWPSPFQHRHSVREALARPFDAPDPADLEPSPWSIQARPGNRRVDPDKPLPTIMTNDRGRVALELEEDPETGYKVALDSHAIAPEWDKLRPGEASERYFNLIRPDLDRPSPTLTAANNRRGVAGVTHPTQRRKLTIAEARRLASFPDDFVLTGSYAERWERIGNCVPPLMAFAVAREVRRILEFSAGVGDRAQRDRPDDGEHE